MPPVNTAAWLPAQNVVPLVVGPAPYTPPGPGQIVVKNHAVAINPVDWAKQVLGRLVLPFIRYPFVLGGDLAGEVVEVAAGVTRFKVGDRVMALAVAAAPESNTPAEGAFQHYTVVRECLAAPIPDWMPFEQACVVPLTLGTAAYGLFHEDFLALDLPTVPARPVTAASKAVIITGGASSVGCNAVQLAAAAGYQVYSTSSPKNFALVKKLGATEVFDYRSKTHVQDLVKALDGKAVAGALVVGDGAADVCMKVLSQVKGSNKFIASAGAVMVPDNVSTFVGRNRFMASALWQMGKTAVTGRATGVQSKFVDTKDLCSPDGVVGREIFQKFLPRALEAKQYVAAPECLVVGKGLDAIQDAMNAQKKGVSAQKVVVTL